MRRRGRRVSLVGRRLLLEGDLQRCRMLVEGRTGEFEEWEVRSRYVRRQGGERRRRRRSFSRSIHSTRLSPVPVPSPSLHRPPSLPHLPLEPLPHPLHPLSSPPCSSDPPSPLPLSPPSLAPSLPPLHPEEQTNSSFRAVVKPSTLPLRSSQTSALPAEEGTSRR